MITLLNGYTELLKKLDINEKTENINKTINNIKEEAITYEEKYSTTIFILKKLLNGKDDDAHEDLEYYLQTQVNKINNKDNINNISNSIKKDIKTLPKNDQIHEINHMIYNSVLNMNKDNED